MNERIKAIRVAAGLTQAAFGERLGVKQNTIARLESGDRVPSDQLVLSICREFGISRRWLENGKGEMIDSSIENDIQILTRAMEGQCEAKKTILRAVASMPDDLLIEVLKYLQEAQKDPRT